MHQRFVQRDHTSERHEGLVAKSGIYEDFETFAKAVLPLREFFVGGIHRKVDTSDFEKVDYLGLDQLALDFLNGVI